MKRPCIDTNLTLLLHKSHHGSHAWRDQQCLPAAVEVAVHHTVVLVHIAGVFVVVPTDHTIVANCLAVVAAAFVVIGSRLVDSSFVHHTG